jgi:hypothetical protein
MLIAGLFYIQGEIKYLVNYTNRQPDIREVFGALSEKTYGSRLPDGRNTQECSEAQF